MKEWIENLLNRPLVAHSVAAVERYNSRLGPQFAAGITYFSVLSMVPILMFSFAALGMTLTVIRPDLMDNVQDWIRSALSDQALSATIGQAVMHSFNQWASVGLVALVTAAYSGTKWAGNLKRAVRVMWSREFEDAARKKFFFLELLLNFLIFLGLLLCVLLSIGIATVGTTLSRTVIAWLGWDHVPGIGLAFAVVSIVANFVASWVLMAFLFMALPNQPARPVPWLTGTMFGAFALMVLQQGAGRIMGLFTGGGEDGRVTTASIFGPVIVIMLLLNIIATTILLSAAWVGSADEWREQRAERIRAKREALEKEAAGTAPEPAEETTEGAAAQTVGVGTSAAAGDRWAATLTDEQLRDPLRQPVAADGERLVREKVATRGMRINLGLGYGVGAATGLGLGALIVSAATRLARHRR